jgi:5-methyltetrahydropteroyltriglutamate--homocysteine methyltransferase
LPRPPDLVAALNSKELGESYDRGVLSARIRRAVSEIVRQQADTGIDVIDDGEHSKVNWMAYARDRLSGLEEIDSPIRFRGATRDSLAFPRAYEDMKVMLAARSSDILAKRRVRPRAQVCSGPITYIGQEELTADIENLKLALKDVAVEEVFITAISPSNLELYYENRHYASSEEYITALADATIALYSTCMALDRGIHRAVVMRSHARIVDLQQETRIGLSQVHRVACRGRQSCAARYSGRSSSFPHLL